MTDLLKDMTFELGYSKKALRVKKGVGGKPPTFTFMQDRFDKLGDDPDPFVPVRGTYKAVSEHAVKLNNLQERSGFIDFLYSPEPAQEVNA